MQRSFTRFSDYDCPKENNTIVFPESDADIIPERYEDYLEDGYNVVAFGSGICSGEYSLFGFLKNIVRTNIQIIATRKEFVQSIGCFHGLFNGKLNEEWLCRALEKGKVVFSEKGIDTFDDTDISEEEIKTIAYICCKYSRLYPDSNEMRECLMNIVNDIQAKGMLPVYMKYMQAFTSDYAYMKKYTQFTSPVLIISGDDTCFGVLKDMADKLAEAMINLGIPVATTDGKYGSYKDIEDFDNKEWKAVIGFQSAFLLGERLANKLYPRLCFWFDNPLFFDNFGEEDDDGKIFLLSDLDYLEYFQTYYNQKNVVFIPPGGGLTALTSDFFSSDYRDLDLVFIGSYKRGNHSFSNELQCTVFNLLCEHPEYTIEEALEIEDSEWAYRESEEKKIMLHDMRDVQREIAAHFRRKVIETILKAGLDIHIFGDSWKDYDGGGKEHLIIHPNTDPKSVPEILKRARISLNVMFWHKAAITERIINSMLSGALCLTDETKYLKKEYSDRENIVLYSLSNMEEIPKIITDLLEDEKRRATIAKNGYEKAIKEETWSQRAEVIINLIDQLYYRKGERNDKA